MTQLPLIGLVGGTTWLSTIDYYRYLNQEVALRRGRLQSARVLLHSVNFGDIVEKERSGDLNGEREILLDAVRSLEQGGAEYLAFCANTAHVHLADIEPKCNVPVISIVDAVAEAISRQGFTRVGMLCTQRTRESGILTSQLASKANCELILPTDAEQTGLDELIRSGAAAGSFNAQHASHLISQISRLQERGAQVVVLGCTELPLALGNESATLPTIDTTRTHVAAILNAAGV